MDEISKLVAIRQFQASALYVIAKLTRRAPEWSPGRVFNELGKYRERMCNLRRSFEQEFDAPKLPKGGFVLLSHNRVRNIPLIVKAALALPFIGKVVVSNSHPRINVRDWVRIDDSRLELVNEPGRAFPNRRFQIARELGYEFNLSIDDDVFLTPVQMLRLYSKLVSEPERPHGTRGCRLDYAGNIELVRDGTAEILITTYGFTGRHLERYLTVLRGSGVDDKLCEDMVLSYSGEKPPRVHDLGDIAECPTCLLPGFALSKNPSFGEQRLANWLQLKKFKGDPIPCALSGLLRPAAP